jgi:hypothetical protein
MTRWMTVSIARRNKSETPPRTLRARDERDARESDGQRRPRVHETGPLVRLLVRAEEEQRPSGVAS